MDELLTRLQAALADRYTIERELGRGGMAIVYLAEDRKHHRPVAIKVLKRELAAALGPDRFLREIETAARLNHPHILPLHDSDNAAGFLYYVMPYVEGETLRDRLNRERQLPLEDALRIAREVADALSYAHSHDVVHRDIKPENILFQSGHAVVSDFGIARAITAAAGGKLTATGIAIGTPGYMSPEQATGSSTLDGRSDLYSLGCVLYEILAGEPPYTGPSAEAVIAAHLTARPKALASARPDTPRAVSDAIMRVLAKDPNARLRTAAEFRDALGRSLVPAAPRSRRRFMLAAVGAGVLVGVMALGGGLLYRRLARVRWVRDHALPQMQLLADQQKPLAALHLLQKAQDYAPNEQAIQRFARQFLLPYSIRTTPPGADAYVEQYTDLSDRWEYVGKTPLDNLRLPFTHFRVRFIKSGHDTVEGSIGPADFHTERVLDSIGSVPTGMVHVPRGGIAVGTRPEVELEEFLIGKYEVTNREYKQFVDAGGYRDRQYWKVPFVTAGRALSWEQAMALYRDNTDRPGPSTWELGSYPPGEKDFPVGGVSWYEAAAYAEFVGKALPTVYHWYRAAQMGLESDILQLSNFSGRGPARVGGHPGLGSYGTYDMAGNVKEWCLNPVGERRYILGGAWSDAVYMYQEPDAKSPFDRAPTNGIRTVKYLRPESVSGALTAPVEQIFRDYRNATPVPDGIFRAYASLYSYDRTALAAKIESEDSSSPDWRRQRITFNAAYGNERVIAYLFLPRTVSPPYQTVVYFPHSGALIFRTFQDNQLWRVDFLIKSGRAVMFPIYKQTFERVGESPIAGPHAYRDQIIEDEKDLGRAIDYLETRPDIDHTRMAYYGLSWGASVAPIMLAIEKRLRVAVLVAGGFDGDRESPEIDPINFAPHLKIPVLILNGRYDFVNPVETSQNPMFHLLGTPAADKRLVLFESGHVPPATPSFKETLNWLDRYLGPVK